LAAGTGCSRCTELLATAASPGGRLAAKVSEVGRCYFAYNTVYLSVSVTNPGDWWRNEVFVYSVVGAERITPRWRGEAELELEVEIPGAVPDRVLLQKDAAFGVKIRVRYT
jgi:hypothetical protein